MTALAGPFDIGLSLEQPSSINRSLCLTNKALVYLLAGLALGATDTEGHRVLAKSSRRQSARRVPPAMSSRFRRVFSASRTSRRHLLDCRKASWKRRGREMALGARGRAGKAPESVRGGDPVEPQPEPGAFLAPGAAGSPPTLEDEIELRKPPSPARKPLGVRPERRRVWASS